MADSLIELEKSVSHFSFCYYDLFFVVVITYDISNVKLQLNIIRIYQQLAYFQQYQERVSALIGSDQTRQLVNRALVLITLGGNDWVNNYFVIPFSPRSRQFSVPDYAKYLVSQYRNILMVSELSKVILLHFNNITYGEIRK